VRFTKSPTSGKRVADTWFAILESNRAPEAAQLKERGLEQENNPRELTPDATDLGAAARVAKSCKHLNEPLAASAAGLIKMNIKSISILVSAALICIAYDAIAQTKSYILFFDHGSG
jgi:hypothetical protein